MSAYATDPLQSLQCFIFVPVIWHHFVTLDEFWLYQETDVGSTENKYILYKRNIKVYEFCIGVLLVIFTIIRAESLYMCPTTNLDNVSSFTRWMMHWQSNSS